VRRPVAAAVVGLVALAGACRRSEPATDGQDPTANGAGSAPARLASPADHLAPGELLEGPEQVFGVALPREVKLRESFVDVAYASGPAAVPALVQYFRARLEDGALREGPGAATFEHVKVRGKPGADLTVRITPAPSGANVEVRDTTPPRLPPLPDEAARWKQVGLTPEGRLADPRHLD
jgi:hypothetical protein